MKTRSGFVSNSSTTSFLIYGTLLKEGDKPSGYRLKELVLECGSPDYSDDKYLGMSWDSVKDDETGLEFKNRVEGLLKEILGRDVDCQTYEEAYYDG